jgi:hypothetical protein
MTGSPANPRSMINAALANTHLSGKSIALEKGIKRFLALALQNQ